MDSGNGGFLNHLPFTSFYRGIGNGFIRFYRAERIIQKLEKVFMMHHYDQPGYVLNLALKLVLYGAK
ncbi:hypothetical protein L1987_69511 [Smallanthus sonchifolius]|uniref:Uncharacterized protein n=1 Tax=Smallanthus sonchifolius TaxID=185202 RepID=A0ACB9B690_9ASTR|nr:hypothetical protein L1987_69511 [Smallanthus sonchifolius]